MDNQNAPTSPVFVSYSRSDVAFASEVVISLECCGFAPKIDQHHLLPGEQWQGELYKMIERASTTVFVMSSASLASAECHKELDYALKRGKRVIPLVIDLAAEANAPEPLKRVQFIRFVGPGRTFAMGIADLVKALRTDIAWVDNHTRYTDRAAEWVTRQRPQSHLLPADALVHALAWLGEPASAGMKVTTEVAEYISASKIAAELAEHKRIEAQALDQLREQRLKARRRLTGVMFAAAFFMLVAGAATTVLVQNANAMRAQAVLDATKAEADRKAAEANKKLAERDKKIADALSQACPAASSENTTADVDSAREKLGLFVQAFLSENGVERRDARSGAAKLLSVENRAALNRGFFELITEQAREQSANRYRLLLGMAQTFAEMTVPVVMDDPDTVIRLLTDIKGSIDDKSLESKVNEAIAAISAPPLP